MMTETTITVSPSEGAPHVKSDPGQASGIRVNVDYFKTLPGILKLVEVLLGIICMACAAPARLPGTNWFLFVVVISFIETLVWIFVYLLSIRESLKIPVNWPLTELVQTFITTCLYITAFIVQLAAWSPYFHHYFKDSNLTAGSFGLFNTLVYGFETYLLYSLWKANGGTANANQ